MENQLIQSFSLYLADRINKYANKEDIEFVKLRLGIELYVISISKLIVIFTISLVLGVFVQTLAVMFAFAFLRKYAFGLHAKNSTVCTVCSTAIMVLLPYMMHTIQLYFSNTIILLIFIAVICVLYKYAPADTESRPLLGEKNRGELKIKAIARSIILMSIVFIIKNHEYKTLMTVGAIFEAILILPFTYKFLKRRWNNYEDYE